MRALVLSLALVFSAPAALTTARGNREATLRSMIGEVALAQVKEIDPRWEPGQRDCAGLVRFAFHDAFAKLAPARLEKPLWLDAHGRAVSFADAETLTQGSFVLLGRGESARRSVASGDLLAFRQGVRGGPEDWSDTPVFHLMLVVRESDPARATLVVYHPGEKDAAVKAGLLEQMLTDAPAEWRPDERNAAFLGFFRFREFGDNR